MNVQQLIDEGREHLFYNSYAWNKVRKKVLKLDNNECQMCKVEGRYTRGSIIHHVHHLKDNPELALSIYDNEGKRNLITVCKYHHELEHPESQKQFVKAKEPITQERWD